MATGWRSGVTKRVSNCSHIATARGSIPFYPQHRTGTSSRALSDHVPKRSAGFLKQLEGRIPTTMSFAHRTRDRPIDLCNARHHTHCAGNVGVTATGNGPEHCSTKQHRLRAGYAGDLPCRGIGDHLQDEGLLAAPPLATIRSMSIALPANASSNCRRP